MFVMTMKKQYNSSENTWSYTEQSSTRFSTLFLGTAANAVTGSFSFSGALRRQVDVNDASDGL